MSRDLTISAVHEQTGIPVTTLRFYEKELPDFFTVRKTAGGHRRYTEESVRQFNMVRKMVESDGIRLSQIREKLAGRPSPQTADAQLRHEVDLLLSVFEAMTEEIEGLRARLDTLEKGPGQHRAQEPPPKDSNGRKRWF